MKLKHLLWLIVIYVAVHVGLKLLGLPTPTELLLFLLNVLGAFNPPASQ
ncbi:MAG: hypothetical protein HYS81_01115 [Candidatus Aenigmatarchaeota archaeon]|nr:MAG: hypothetical protein HYS81_01115 [Candidatus Aenigmarchaeota archaeon]